MKRICYSINDALLAKLDELAEQMNLSRSALLAVAINDLLEKRRRAARQAPKAENGVSNSLQN